MAFRVNYASGRNKSIEKSELIKNMEDAKQRFFEGGGTITVIQSTCVQTDTKKKKKRSKKR